MKSEGVLEALPGRICHPHSDFSGVESLSIGRFICPLIAVQLACVGIVPHINCFSEYSFTRITADGGWLLGGLNTGKPLMGHFARFQAVTPLCYQGLYTMFDFEGIT